MDEINVTHISTDLIIENNIKIDTAFDAKYSIDIQPLIDLNKSNQTALFKVAIISRFSLTRPGGLPFKLTTLSTFKFEKFELYDNTFEFLEEYVQVAFCKHVRLLKEKVLNAQYSSRIKNSLERYQYESSLLTILPPFAQDSKPNLIEEFR